MHSCPNLPPGYMFVCLLISYVVINREKLKKNISGIPLKIFFQKDKTCVVASKGSVDSG